MGRSREMKRLCQCGYFTESALWTSNICPLCVERMSRSAAVIERERASRDAEFGPSFVDEGQLPSGRNRLTCEHNEFDMCDPCRKVRHAGWRANSDAKRRAKYFADTGREEPPKVARVIDKDFCPQGHPRKGPCQECNRIRSRARARRIALERKSL